MGRKSFENQRVYASGGQVKLSCLLSCDHPIEDVFTIRRKIYRRKIEGFVYGVDYMEYFDGIGQPDEGELIFEGIIPQETQRWCTYTDGTAEIGSIYVYWLRDAGAEAAEFSGPLAVKLRDPRFYWPHDEVNARLDALAAKYPGLATVRDFGRSAKNKAIRGLRIGNPARQIAVVGAIHASEVGPEIIIPVVGRILAQRPELVEKTGLSVLPCVNVDGRERHILGLPAYHRVSGNNVDINRNFPSNWDQVDTHYGLDTSAPWSYTYRGAFPASENETRAVMDFTRAADPIGVISFHGMGTSYLLARCAEGDEEYRRKALSFYTPYCAAFQEVKTEKDVFMPYACSNGSYPAWVYLEFGVPCADLEFNKGSAYFEHMIRDVADADAQEYYEDTHYKAFVSLLETTSRA